MARGRIIAIPYAAPLELLEALSARCGGCGAGWCPSALAVASGDHHGGAGASVEALGVAEGAGAAVAGIEALGAGGEAPAGLFAPAGLGELRAVARAAPASSICPRGTWCSTAAWAARRMGGGRKPQQVPSVLQQLALLRTLGLYTSTVNVCPPTFTVNVSPT